MSSNNHCPQQTIAFLIFPGFPMACLTSAIEPLRAANEITNSNSFDWIILSEDGKAVRSSAKVNFEADGRLDEGEMFDALYLLSPPLVEFAQPEKSKAILHRLGRSPVTLGAFSGGVFPLCDTGVMRDCQPSVHWVYRAAFETQFPNHPFTDKVISKETRRESASGAAAVFDLMLMRVQELLGQNISHEVACWFQHPFLQDEDMRQRIPERLGGHVDTYLPPIVAAAIDHIQREAGHQPSIEELASAVGVSTRTLNREFRKSLGRSPLQHINRMRIDQVRQQVRYSNDSLEEICHSTGFGSLSAMVKSYRSTFGVTPAADRKTINRARVEHNRSLPTI